MYPFYIPSRGQRFSKKGSDYCASTNGSIWTCSGFVDWKGFSMNKNSQHFVMFESMTNGDESSLSSNESTVKICQCHEMIMF